MDRRTLILIIASSWILVIFMLMNAPNPKQKGANKTDENSENVQENDKDGKDKAGKENDGKDKTGEDKNDSNKEAQKDSPDDNSAKSKDPNNKNPDQDKKSKPSEDKASKQEKSKQTKEDDGEQADDSANKVDGKENVAGDGQTKSDQEDKRRVIPQKFISLGSLASDSPYRFLVTFDNTAASVHRLELVQRLRKKDKLKYKDLEVKYGFLGHLDLLNDEDGGCIVHTVGQGTPAAVAGIKVDDRVVSFNGESVESRLDFEILLRKTRPGDEVTIGLKRGSEEISVPVELSNQPLEVIRPNIVPDQASFAFEQVAMRKSFAISLFEPTGNEWQPLGNAHEDTWEAEVGDDWVKFYYPYKSEQETRDAKIDYQVIKTFKLEPVGEDDRDNIQSMNYHLNFDVEVKNIGKESKSFAYRVDGPNGLPTEDWWFAIKIHGEWSAVFTQAGARDVVASTVAKSFHFIGGPKLFTNGTKEAQRKPQFVIDPGNDNGNAHLLKYIGIDSHYFVSALIPTDGESIVARETYSAYAMPQYVKLSEKGEEPSIAQKRNKEAKWYRKLVPVNFKAYFLFENPNGTEQDDKKVISPDQTVKHSFMIFAGPKEPALLKQYGIDDTVTFGWFAAFSWPLVKLLHLFFAIIGNYAIAIVLLTILVRLAMMRFSRKMVLNSQMMQLLAPEIKAISEKFKDDFQAKSRAQQELFRKYNYNPFSGCLVMLIQLPVFIGLYRGLSVDMALRDQPLIPGVGWCSNLAGPDQLWRWADDLPAFFSFLTHETGWLGPYFNVLPIISVVLMLIQQKLFTPPPTDEQQAMMQKVMTFMMVFIGIIFFKVPAGLCIYFITSTLWAIMEKKLVPPPQLPEHLQKRLDEIKELQAKEKADGVEPGTYTNVTTTAGGNATRKHTERAKRKSQKNRRK